jgi:hypothetical protein
MREPGRLQLSENLIGPTQIHGPIGQPIASADNLVTGNLNQGDGLGISRLETDRCAGGDIEAEPVGLQAVEVQLRIRLDEVVMRSDLAVSDYSSVSISPSR